MSHVGKCNQNKNNWTHVKEPRGNSVSGAQGLEGILFFSLQEKNGLGHLDRLFYDRKVIFDRLFMTDLFSGN